MHVLATRVGKQARKVKKLVKHKDTVKKQVQKALPASVRSEVKQTDDGNNTSRVRAKVSVQITYSQASAFAGLTERVIGQLQHVPAQAQAWSETTDLVQGSKFPSILSTPSCCARNIHDIHT